MHPLNEYRWGAFPFWGGILGVFLVYICTPPAGGKRSVRGEFQLDKLRIGQQFQFFDNTL